MPVEISGGIGQKRFQIGDINDHPVIAMHRAAVKGFDQVIVSVQIRRFAKLRPIFFRIPIVDIQTARSAEKCFAA